MDYLIQPGKWRFTLRLEHPRTHLIDVPIERNPHGFGFNGHDCFYECNDWSTIFGVNSFIIDDGRSIIECTVESGNPEPIWGERMTLLSTSSYILNEPWGQNRANKFAFFRDFYWRITEDRFHHDYFEMNRLMGNRSVYPIRMEPYPFDGLPVRGNVMNRNRGVRNRGVRNRGIMEDLMDGDIGMAFGYYEPTNWLEDGF